jgi:acyl-CoA thioester hydrolase
MEAHSTVIRARYAETDQMGIVHHANYYIWMEVARVDLCQALGFRYRDMERDHGVLLAVVESTCRYAGSAHFDDEVVIETRISEASSRMILFCYDLSVDGRPIASGVTRHVFLNREMKPTRVPSQYRAFFGLRPQ